MKKILLLLFLLAGFVAESQKIPMETVLKYKKIHPQKLKAFRLGDTVVAKPTSGTILLFTPNVAVNFTRLTQNAQHQWTLGAQITSGLTYTFVVGKGWINPDGTYTVEPYFSLGAYADGGLAQNNNGGTVIGTASVGGILGLYKYFSILAAYDVVNKTPIFGLGASFSLLNFSTGAGTAIIKSNF